MTGVSGFFVNPRGERPALYDRLDQIDSALKNVEHIQTLLASIMSLLDDIPEDLKMSMEIGFISSFSVKGKPLDINIVGKGKAVKTAIEGLINSVEQEVKK